MKGRSMSLSGLGLLFLAACGDGLRDDQRTGAVTEETIRRARQDLAPEVRTALDSGNATYRRGELEAALAHFRIATALDPEAAAAWFGIYMTELARGNPEAAHEALLRAHRAAPAASLLEEPNP